MSFIRTTLVTICPHKKYCNIIDIPCVVYYIQVAYSIAEEKAYEREMNAFNGISQMDRKIIITNDELDYSTSNIQHIKLKDFLLMENL